MKSERVKINDEFLEKCRAKIKEYGRMLSIPEVNELCNSNNPFSVLIVDTLKSEFPEVPVFKRNEHMTEFDKETNKYNLHK